MKQLRLAVAALRDLAEATSHIAEDNPAAAERLQERLDQACNLLGEFPALGMPHQGGKLRLFAVPGTAFHLLYRQHAGGITILRIHHGARRWPPLPG